MMEHHALVLSEYVSDRLIGTDCKLTANVTVEQISAYPFPGIPENSNPKFSLEKPELVSLPGCLIGCTIGLLIDWDIKSVSPDLIPVAEYWSGQAYLLRKEVGTIDELHDLFSESLAYTYPIAFVLKQDSGAFESEPKIWIVSGYDRDGYILSFIS